MTPTTPCCTQCLHLSNFPPSYCINPGCPCHATKNLSWEEEFDREFPDRAFYENGRDLKAFFSAKLAKQKNELRGKIEGMRRTLSFVNQDVLEHDGAYNEALTDIIRTLD